MDGQDGQDKKSILTLLSCQSCPSMLIVFDESRAAVLPCPYNSETRSSLITPTKRNHVARTDDSRPAHVSFYTQSAVRLKAARDALERLVCERDAHTASAREGRARLPLAYDFGRTIRRVQRLVSSRERAHERLKQALRVGRARRLFLDGCSRLKNLRREGPVVEIDADADDDRAPPRALDRLREYAAQLPTRSEQVVRPLDGRPKPARLNNRVRSGGARRQRAWR